MSYEFLNQCIFIYKIHIKSKSFTKPAFRVLWIRDIQQVVERVHQANQH